MKQTLIWFNWVALFLSALLLLVSLNYSKRAVAFNAKIEAVLAITAIIAKDPSIYEVEAFFSQLTLRGADQTFIEKIDSSIIRVSYRIPLRRNFPIGAAEHLSYTVYFSDDNFPRLEYELSISPW